MTTAWGGRRVTAARAQVATWLPMQCARCSEVVDGSEPWVVGHIKSRATHPELTWQPRNWAPEHRRCSDRTGQASVIAKAKQDALREIQNLNPGLVFPDSDGPGQSPLLPVSPSEPARATQSLPETRADLLWSTETMQRHAWLSDYAAVPPGASAPLWMSPPHADAVGSYGADCIEWVEKSQGITLRWWQRLAIARQLEHREDGTLCWVTILESAPRRAGKSVRIRGIALWRMAVGPTLFGERQEVVHTGSDIAVCRKVQKSAWQWCLAQDWTVTKGNGKEAVETAAGDTWLVRAQDSVYGWDTTLGLVDEGWDVRPDTVDEGLEPSLLERSSPQLHMTSTAHRRARSTMRSRLSDALVRDDGETLVLVWAALPTDDPADPQTWRKASPHWTEARRKMIGAKYAKALAGEADPEADDPDPLKGWEAQYLNIWRLSERRAVPGNPVVEAESWAALTAPLPERVPDAVTIESWFESGVSVARAWRVGDRAVVAVSDYDDLVGAAEDVRRWNVRRRVIVGASLAEDPALKGLRLTPSSERLPVTVADLSRLLNEGALHHDGGEHLADQVTAVRTQPGPDGFRVVSKGRADAVKAAVWAAESARKISLGKPRILLPSNVR